MQADTHSSTDKDQAPIWGLPKLCEDTFATVVAAIERQSHPRDVAAFASTSLATRAALKPVLLALKKRRVDAICRRVGWDKLRGAQLLHAAGTGITDDELLLLSSGLLFNADDGGGFAPLLVHLDLASNQISDRGIIGFVDAASRAPRMRLRQLILSYNDIGDQGATALARALEEGNTLPGLTTISFGGNGRISAAGEAALKAACKVARVSVISGNVEFYQIW